MANICWFVLLSVLEQTVKWILKSSLTAFVDDEYIFDKVDGMKKKSDRKKIILVESNLWSSPSPASGSEYIHLEDIAVSHIHLGSECLQAWRFQSISGKLFPVFDYSHSASIFSLLFSKTVADGNKISPSPPLLQAE